MKAGTRIIKCCWCQNLRGVCPFETVGNCCHSSAWPSSGYGGTISGAIAKPASHSFSEG